MSEKNRQIVLVRNPQGEFASDDFELREGPVPTPDEGEFLVRNHYLSLDPANRLWAAPTETYVPPVRLGDVMRGFTIGEVIESRHPDFQVGEMVQGMDGWQDYGLSNGVNHNSQGRIDTWKLDGIQQAGLPLTTGLSVLGTTGLAAYYGLVHVGRPKKGETVLVSGAAGATGSIAGQIAKIKGCRAIGIAGSDEKCEKLRNEFQYDAAINYKTEDVDAALSRHAPDGVDIYFDNVGGGTLDTALTHIAMGARVVICGAISQYPTAEQGIQGPSNYTFLLFKRASMHGFIVLDHYPDLRAQMENDLVQWLKQGRLHYADEIVEGLENAPEAVNRLYEGANFGKLMVKI